MTLPSFSNFRDAKLTQGFDEVVERVWLPGTVVPRHTHPFQASAIVVHGEMWLTIDGGAEQHLLPGEGFELTPNEPHQERYGANGATYWVARREGKP